VIDEAAGPLLEKLNSTWPLPASVTSTVICASPIAPIAGQVPRDAAEAKYRSPRWRSREHKDGAHPPRSCSAA